MKLSIAICTHNEGDYIPTLLKELTDHVAGRHDLFEIVVVDDFSTDERVTDALHDLGNVIRWEQHALNHDFATHKNFMNTQCSGDWILNLDADERIPLNLLEALPHIIQANPAVEAYWIPRVNTVDGLTLAHVQKWGWVLTELEGFVNIKYVEPDSEEFKLLHAYNLILSIENGYVRYKQPIVCWPDMQMRLYRNDAKIQWSGRVHERLIGFDHFSTFPAAPEYALRHHKEIGRQEKQNSYYETLQR